MTKIEAKPRIIEGEWDWCEIAANLPDEGWTPLEKMPVGEHIWCFRADGAMKSQMYDRIVYDVEYHFDPAALRLTLRGWQIYGDSTRKSRIDEFYRVEFPSLNEMLLYDLEDVAVGLEEESLRLRFTRI